MKTQIFLLLVIFIASCQNQIEREIKKYDEEFPQQEILTKKGIDSVLNEFEVVSYNDLTAEYFAYTDPEEEYKSKLKKLKYRVVKGKDVFKTLVGKYRVMNFVTTDQFYHDNLDNLEENRKLYWLIDENLLYMILEFILKLEELGYDKYGFTVRESHRHPKANTMRGGATQSQHLFGRAADLEIKDINQDGKITPEDKDICLEILEDIVNDKGGMGLYPGTQTIHIDCRGHRARWNSYKRPTKK